MVIYLSYFGYWYHILHFDPLHLLVLKYLLWCTFIHFSSLFQVPIYPSPSVSPSPSIPSISFPSTHSTSSNPSTVTSSIGKVSFDLTPQQTPMAHSLSINGSPSTNRTPSINSRPCINSPLSSNNNSPSINGTPFAKHTPLSASPLFSTLPHHVQVTPSVSLLMQPRGQQESENLIQENMEIRYEWVWLYFTDHLSAIYCTVGSLW